MTQKSRYVFKPRQTKHQSTNQSRTYSLHENRATSMKAKQRQVMVDCDVLAQITYHLNKANICDNLYHLPVDSSTLFSSTFFQLLTP